MKKHFCILFCLALLGCQDQKPEKPENLIPESKMVSILADIHTAEAQVESTIAYPDTALMVFSNLQKDIWKKHGITEEQFRVTYDFYVSHVPEMDKLYEIITDTLMAREANYATKESSEFESEPDSLRLDSTSLERTRRSIGETQRPEMIN